MKWSKSSNSRAKVLANTIVFVKLKVISKSDSLYMLRLALLGTCIVVAKRPPVLFQLIQLLLLVIQILVALKHR